MERSVAVWPAVSAHCGVAAVTTSRAAVIGKASAKVSSMGTSLMVSKLGPLLLVTKNVMNESPIFLAIG